MADHKHTITINGKVYDANTGILVAPPVAAVETTKPTVQPRTVVHNHDVVPAKTMHHRSEKAKTLMRSVVKKPATPAARAQQAQGSLQGHHHAPTASADVLARHKIPDERLERAASTNRSQQVSHFNAIGGPTIVKRHKPLQVKVAPQKTTHHVIPTPIAPTQKSDKDLLIDSALLRAISHEQPKHQLTKRRHRAARKMGLSPRFVSISASLIIIVLVGAFFAYQNLPRLAMRIAASKSGIHATLPGYKPSGFTLSGAITYAPGQVTVNFHSKYDDQAFSIIQTRSGWDSQGLQAGFVANTKQPVQTFQERGRTIFVYNKSSATWVDGGVWYKVEGNADLNTDQLVRLAASF